MAPPVDKVVHVYFVDSDQDKQPGIKNIHPREKKERKHLALLEQLVMSCTEHLCFLMFKAVGAAKGHLVWRSHVWSLSLLNVTILNRLSC